jgi:hypothetical protein
MTDCHGFAHAFKTNETEIQKHKVTNQLNNLQVMLSQKFLNDIVFGGSLFNCIVPPPIIDVTLANFHLEPVPPGHRIVHQIPYGKTNRNVNKRMKNP